MHHLEGHPIFPLKMRSWTKDWMLPGNPKKRSSSFGSARPGRLHAGCDLHVPAGTEVYPVASGTVFYVAAGFPGHSKAIQVNHDGFIAIYGEVIPEPGVVVGTPVTQDVPIAKVANQGRESQLHFELYLNLSNRKTLALLPGGVVRPPYNRALTPQNPTPYLIEWQKKVIETPPRP